MKSVNDLYNTKHRVTKWLNNLLDIKPLWQVFIFAWIFLGLFTSGLFTTLMSCIPDLGYDKILWLGVTLGAVFGILSTLITYSMRKSQEFWSYAQEVEKLVEDASSKTAIDSIFDNEYKKLRTMTMGHAHYYEVNRLYTMMVTKYKYI